MTYSKADYEHEKTLKFVNPDNLHDSCGHVLDGWCGVCFYAQPPEARRHFGKFRQVSR